jgi:hypothetical protein
LACVHEEQAGSWHIVLPAKPANRGELSDEELEKVAGGTDVVTLTVLIVASEAVAGGATAAVSWASGQGDFNGW